MRVYILRCIRSSKHCHGFQLRPAEIISEHSVTWNNCKGSNAASLITKKECDRQKCLKTKFKEKIAKDKFQNNNSFKPSSCSGAWGVLDKYFGIGEPLWVWNLTLFRKRTNWSKIHTLFRVKPWNILPCLRKRTCTLFGTNLREIVYLV